MTNIKTYNRMVLLPGNVSIDLQELIMVYPLKPLDNAIRILTKTAGIIVIREQDLYLYNRSVSLVGFWHELVTMLTGAETNWVTKPGKHTSRLMEVDGKLKEVPE